MTHKAVLKEYFSKLARVAGRGDAREESFYSSLEKLLARVCRDTGRTHVQVTTLPKSTEAGNPDFRLWNGTSRIVGYIEAKKPAQENLDTVEESEQLRRYRDTFPNLILTNFFEFRLYRNGERVDTVLAGRPYVLNQLQSVPPVEKATELWSLLDRFLGFSLPETYSAETLAIELAKRTRFLRDLVSQQVADEQADNPGILTGFYEAFSQYLIGELTHHDFADLYAQTITYGLFAARSRADNGFNRRMAFDKIPHTIGILRDVFRFISLGDLPTQLEWVVDDISEVLAVADAPGILEHYYHDGKGSDPIVHFYETFLAQYDPQEREHRGVYYTPEPVVSYIVRSLHKLLRKEFDKPDGLASEGVTLLDPAAGTMTFVARAAQEAVQEFEQKYGGGGREELIRGHILQNYHAFELMMAPYAVGHLKMSFFLEELGHRLTEDERFKFYLTNTLEMDDLAQTHLPGMASLAEESRLAGEVKKERLILVVLGNPPYSGHSANKGRWILDEIEHYKQVDGNPLGEKNPKWLQDDYVKFLRFAQGKIDQTGQGVVGMITNHSYLDNPTFRGMRQSLLRTFDEIYILDLHGNSLKREVCPDGSADKNVFDIRQGVAIAFFVKRGVNEEIPARVRHAELWGLRRDKYDWLLDHDIRSTDWQRIQPKSGFYLFVPRNEAALERYNEFVKVTDLFPVHSVGIVTSRDKFVIDFDKDALKRRIRQFRDPNMPDELVRQAFKLRNNRDWDMSEKRKEIQLDEDWESKIVQCLYRPFDRRWIFYHYHAIDFGREKVMRHMITGKNIGLIIPKRVELSGGWQHALASSLPVEHVAVSLKTIDYFMPLYLYPDTGKKNLFSHLDEGKPKANLNANILMALVQTYGAEPSPEEIFNYVYAVLFAGSYREKYAEFLKLDFPRIPFTADRALFKEFAALGKRLVSMHLLKSDELSSPRSRFEGDGDSRVTGGKGKDFHYSSKEERVYINRNQYFAPVPMEIWEYRIGGYQVCEKWLKDRKERRLSVGDIRTYCRIVTALERTIEIQEELDALYPKLETQLVPIELFS